MASINGLSNYTENRIIDAIRRGQTFTPATTLFYGMIRGKLGTTGKWTATTAYALGDLIVPNTHNGRFYRCTTAGITGASEPIWSTTDGGTNAADGTAAWIEMSPDADASTNLVEVSGGGYARVGVTASLANFAGTQGVGTTVASTGTSGTTSNNGVITFPTITADWGPVIAFFIYDAVTAGNLLEWSVANLPLIIQNGQSPVTIPVAGNTLTIG